MTLSDDDLSDNDKEQEIEDMEFKPNCFSSEPHLLSQGDLNDLVRDLNLSKKQSELLGSRLKGWNLLQKETKVSVYRTRHSDFADFFSLEDGVVFCNDVHSVMEALNHRYSTNDWRLFIDSSKASLKAVLLHNGNMYPSVPLAHAINMKETYESMKLLLQKIRYKKHESNIWGDLKVVALLLGMQLGYTKFCCFLCEWTVRIGNIIMKRMCGRNDR